MNNISVVWTSDQRQLIADMQKRQVMQDKEIARLKQIGDTGKATGNTLTSSYRESSREIERLGKLAETAFKKPVSAIDLHLTRMKELRVLYRMGKIDAEQFDRAASASMRQKHSDPLFASAAKSLAEQKAAALSLQAQKLAAIHEIAQTEKSAAAKSLAEQKAAAASLQAQKLTAIHQITQDERTAAAKSLAEQKAAALSLQLQKLTAVDQISKDQKIAAAKSLAEQKAAAASLQAQKLAAIHQLTQDERSASAKSLAEQKAAALALQLQKLTALHQLEQDEKNSAASSLAAQKAAAMSLDLQKQTAIEEQRQQQKVSAESVRRSLMSEREIARQNFRERMRQLFDLKKTGQLSSAEYNAAAKEALKTWTEASKIDMSGVWGAVPGQLRAALTVTGAVLASVRLVRSELDNLQTKQKESANTTMTYAEAQSEAVQNLDDSMTSAELDKSVMDMAKKKGISPAFVMRAASNVLGARGAVSAKDAMGAIGTSIDFNPFNQGAANFTASAILQAKAARPDASYEALLGQQKSAKIASPVVSDQDFAHYLVPGASGASAFKDSERDFYSLAAHLGARMGDTSGRVTGTATIDLQRDLATHPFLKDVKAGGEGATMAKLRAIAFDKKYASVKGTLLGEVNAKSQDELVKSGGKLTTEARAYGAIALLLQGDKESWRQLEQKRGEVLEPGKQAEALVDLQRKGLAGLPAQQTARAQKGMEAEGEILDLENQGAARGAVSREALQNLLRKAGVPKIEQVMSGIRFEVGSNGGEQVPASQAEQIIRQYSKSKASPYVDQGGFNAYGPEALMKRFFESVFSLDRPRREATPEELKASESLLRAANALEALAKLPPPNVQVNVPGENKPAPVPAVGLQGGGRF